MKAVRHQDKNGHEKDAIRPLEQVCGDTLATGAEVTGPDVEQLKRMVQRIDD